jgi:guanylate kinase
MPEVVLIWIYTKNIEVLRTRMGVRMRDDQAEIERRLLLAQAEIEEEEQNRLYQYHIFNDIFEQSLEDLKKVLRNFLDEQICDQSVESSSRSIDADC